MELACTKKLLEYLGVKPEKSMDSVEPILEWTANLIVVNRWKMLVVVHGATRCAFVLYGVTAKLLPKLPELILEGIRTLLRSEYVRPEIIEKYLDDLGREVSFRANSSRKAVAGCNKVCERVKMCPEPYPHCVMAVGDAPMEGCGGPDGFRQVMAVLKDKKHPQYQETLEWVRSTWWQPLDVKRINGWIRNIHRRMSVIWLG